MNKIYKLEFEIVSPIGKGMIFYSYKQPNTKPSDVPDEYWLKSSRQTDDPFDQYNTLKKWVKEGFHLVRNVKLYEQISQSQWIELVDKL